MLEAGAQAPDFEIRTLEGGSLSLKDILARGPALLAFFKVSCPVCQLAWPYLQRMYQGAGGKDAVLQIMGVSQDDAESAADFCREFGITFPTLLDDPKQYTASNAFRIDTVPSLFLIETDGRISKAVSGFSKRGLEAIGERMGAQPFRPGDRAPDFRPG